MTFRGVYQNGVVVLSGDVDLENGTPVDVNPSRSGAKRSRRSSSKKPARKEHPLIALAGIWKDRPEWKSMTSVEVLADIRRSRSAPATRRRAAKRKGVKRG
jgi:hypothetical protein